MKQIKVIALFIFLVLNIGVTAQEEKWNGFERDSVFSTLDNEVQYFYYYRSSNQTKMPLVISLHQWGADYSESKNSLAPQTKAKNWNYIHPDFRGKNNHIKACGSKYVIADIDDAIDWAIKHLSVDTTQIFIVGASGGGYAALCHFMKSKHAVKEYSVWVPISDLKTWYFESKSRGSYYAGNIIKCTCSDCKEIDINKAIERSPLYWKIPLEKLKTTKLNIYAGIHDGHTGAVPVTHSIFFYNKIVSALGGNDDVKISPDETVWMLTTRSSPEKMKTEQTLGDRKVMYKKKYKNTSITIFDGGHEILVDEILK